MRIFIVKNRLETEVRIRELIEDRLARLPLFEKKIIKSS